MAYSKLSFLFSATLAFTLAGCGSDDSDSGDGDETAADGSGGSTDGSGGTESGSGGTESGSGGTDSSPDTSTDAGGTNADSSTDAGGTASDTGGSGGTSGTPTSGTTTGGDACNPMSMGGSGGSDECTDYGECVQRECDAEYSECWGPGYANGDLSGGSCSSLFECAEDCPSDENGCDPACLLGCFGNVSEGCQTCLEAAEECGTESCPDEYEECNGAQTTSTTGDTSTTGGFEGTCTDLEDCCNSMDDADTQTECLETVDQIQESSGDQADATCAALLAGYEAAGMCASAP